MDASLKCPSSEPMFVVSTSLAAECESMSVSSSDCGTGGGVVGISSLGDHAGGAFKILDTDGYIVKNRLLDQGSPTRPLSVASHHGSVCASCLLLGGLFCDDSVDEFESRASVLGIAAPGVRREPMFDARVTAAAGRAGGGSLGSSRCRLSRGVPSTAADTRPAERHQPTGRGRRHFSNWSCLHESCLP